MSFIWSSNLTKHRLFLLTKSGMFVHAVSSKWNGFFLPHPNLPFWCRTVTYLSRPGSCYLLYEPYLTPRESFGFITFRTYHYSVPVTLVSFQSSFLEILIFSFKFLYTVWGKFLMYKYLGHGYCSDICW